ncbi:MAG TPA: trehalose-6-phosphate synthase [Acidimicrobiales bacterium]
MAEDLVIVSNRGPVSFHLDDRGELVAKQGAGGLVSSLAPLVEGTGATWVAAAMSDADRQAAAAGLIEAEGFRFRALAIDPVAYRMAYDVISNATLWFLNHRLFDLARRPSIDRRWREAWDAYRHVNRSFAEAVMADAPPGATVLVQDYHLSLVGTWLAQERPDLRAVHFTHTPFANPTDLRILPDDAAEELLVGMASHSTCGFHTRQWASAFEACCEQVLGTRPRTFVAPLAPDAESLAEVAASDACAAAGREIEEQVGECRMILRVDRIELSKNLLRGFLAYEELLRSRREWVGRVVFVAYVYPSREGLPEYLAYRQEVEGLAARINDRWATPGWTPVHLDTSDDFPRSMAALQRYDVLLVNPIRDGLNLVAKEGPLINRSDGVLALSREAGAWEEMAGVALEVNPFDVAGTADVLAAALSMSPEERRAHASALREVAGRRSPRDWLDDQLAAARAAG